MFGKAIKVAKPGSPPRTRPGAVVPQIKTGKPVKKKPSSTVDARRRALSFMPGKFGY